MTDVLGPAQWFGLDEKFWTAVGVIAWLRMWANDPIRGTTRTRGDEKNWLNDAQGAFGELLAIRRSEGASGATVTAQDLVDFSGPVDDVDLTLEAAGGIYRIEAKGLLWDPSKKRFLINEIARERSDRRGAHGYLLSFGEFGGPRAVVGQIVSMASVRE